jgi:hypothetical protein
MADSTSRQLARYYTDFRDTEIICTSDVVQTLNIDPQQIFIKIADSQWPCIINSVSLAMTKVIVGSKSGALSGLCQQGRCVNLRFGFSPYRAPPITFFISAKIANIAPYSDSESLVIVTLAYVQRPPDDLIEILGQYSDANLNWTQKREERISISAETLRKLSLSKEDATIIVHGESKRCILRDLGFAWARVMLMGIQTPLDSKKVLLRFAFDDMNAPVHLPGVITEISMMEGPNNLAIAILQYAEHMIPMSYKIHLNRCLSRTRKNALKEEQSSPWFTATDVFAGPKVPETSMAGNDYGSS